MRCNRFLNTLNQSSSVLSSLFVSSPLDLFSHPYACCFVCVDPIIDRDTTSRWAPATGRRSPQLFPPSRHSPQLFAPGAGAPQAQQFSR
jgi:hypothetical protein